MNIVRACCLVATESVFGEKTTIDVDNVEALEAAAVLDVDATTLVFVTC